MKILSVADTVTQMLLDPVGGGPAIEGIDLIFGCGDLPPEYLTNLRHRYDVPLYYVLGNHDLRFETAPPTGCNLIDRQLTRFGGLTIAGFSGSRWYNGNINQYSDKQMASFIRNMWFRIWRSGGIDLIITHAPPRYIHDAEDLCHRGFRSFRSLIEKYEPRYFIHGHIHKLFEDDSQRVTTFNTTSVINSYGYYVLEI